MKPKTVNPTVSANHHKPLWCVSGHDCFPEIMCCYITNDFTIWGYSVYKRQPGFRTLGQSLFKWMDNHHNPKFFDSQDEAMNYLRYLVSPRCEVPAPRTY
jgi:hypothetical protein